MNIEFSKEFFQIEVIKDTETLNNILDAKLDQYKGFIVTEQNEKEMYSVLEELDNPRKVISKERARLNKEYTAFAKERLGKIDEIINKIKAVSDPIKESLDFFKEQRRLERLKKKFDMIMPLIDQYNENIEAISSNLKFIKIEKIEFNEDWANKKDEDIQKIVDEIGNQKLRDISSHLERYEIAKEISNSFKSLYDLKLDINFDTLEEQIYSLSYNDLKAKIEALAIRQQEVECNVEEAVKNEIQDKLEVQEVKKVEIQEKQTQNKRRKVRIDVLLMSDDVNLELRLKDLLELNYSVLQISTKEF